MKKNSSCFLIALYFFPGVYAKEQVDVNTTNTIKKGDLEHSKNGD